MGAVIKTVPEEDPASRLPGHYRVRRVSSAGTFRINVHQPFISSALAGLDIDVEEIEDGIHNLFFYDTLIARYDERRRLLDG